MPPLTLAVALLAASVALAQGKGHLFSALRIFYQQLMNFFIIIFFLILTFWSSLCRGFFCISNKEPPLYTMWSHSIKWTSEHFVNEFNDDGEEGVLCSVKLMTK
jgi:hypothetical protein